MAKKQSKSARIRKLLDQGKSVKQIVGMLDVTPQFVYTIRAQDKKKLDKEIAAVREDLKKRAAQQAGEWKMVATYTKPELSLWQRIKNFVLGA